MPKFRKKPVVIEAHRWLRNGDHPEDDCEMIDDGEGPYKGEGKIVRYYRNPDVPGTTVCRKDIYGVSCAQDMHVHGWIDTLEDGHTVCPGDWIIRGVKGELYPCKPDIFEQTYEKVEDLPASTEGQH